MSKKDGETNPGNKSSEEANLSPDEKALLKEPQPDDKTVVKNAHATGLGAMGRNDEKGDSNEDGSDQY